MPHLDNWPFTVTDIGDNSLFVQRPTVDVAYPLLTVPNMLYLPTSLTTVSFVMAISSSEGRSVSKPSYQ